MKALILSAGQGRRLLPLTAESPKCILPILGRSMIEYQIDELIKSGINRVTVVVGYGAIQVERLLKKRYGANHVTILHNPDFAESDNLVSCWMAREEMNEDFILLNGDTLFEVAVVKRLIGGPARPVTVVIDQKISYDNELIGIIFCGERQSKKAYSKQDVDFLKEILEEADSALAIVLNYAEAIERAGI